MKKEELKERLKSVVRELSSISHDDYVDGDFILTIQEDTELCNMRKKLRTIIENIDEREGSE